MQKLGITRRINNCFSIEENGNFSVSPSMRVFLRKTAYSSGENQRNISLHANYAVACSLRILKKRYNLKDKIAMSDCGSEDSLQNSICIYTCAAWS